MKNVYKLVAVDDKIYTVVICKDGKYFVMDYDDEEKLPNKTFYIGANGYAACTNNHSTELVHLLLLPNEDEAKSVDHINRIQSDNRKINLRLASNHVQRKNQIRKRSSSECPLDLSCIPSYIWYVKANGHHGERFCVEIDDYVWKTTSSKQFGVRYKLEEAKKHLRHLIRTRPELFCDTPFHGELSERAQQLKQEYIEILRRAHVDYVDQDPIQYLEEDLTGLSDEEVKLLRSSSEANNQRARCSLPEDCGVKSKDIPKYCYYVPATESKGDAFCVGRLHPKQKCTKKDWTTTKKRQITTKQKFEMMIKYLNNENKLEICII